jgi:hypothetical protein
MFNTAILLFTVAAVAGLSIAIMHLRDRKPPRPLMAALHGVFAASGLVILLMAVARSGTGGRPLTALGLLVLAALGGFVLLSFHVRGRPLPAALIAGHGLLAVLAYGLLASAVLVR